MGISKLFVWDAYGLENILLDAELIRLSLVRLRDKETPTLETIQGFLAKALEAVQPEVGGIYVTKTQTAYRALGKDKAFDDGARDAFNFVSSLQTLEQRLQFYPGKKVFGQFVQVLQEQCGINLRLEDIVAVLNTTNCPVAFKQLFAVLEALKL